MRSKLTYSNVISTLCLFLLLGGGTAFAASQLGKNSVGTKQLKKNSVTGAKVKKGTLTGANINLAKLGTVPSATNATTANTATTAGTANALGPAEAIHVVGAPGQPAFENGSITDPIEIAPGIMPSQVSFYKDQTGVVHLEGVAEVGTGSGPIFTLPPGFRPLGGKVLFFEPIKEGVVLITGSALTSFNAGAVLGTSKTVSLDGITFRAQG